MPSKNKMELETREQKIHRERSLRKFFMGLCLLVITCFLVVWSYAANERKNHPPPNFLSLHIAALHRNSTSPSVLSSEESISFYSDFGINSDDYSRLQQAVYWASPDRAITNVSMSTSPGHTTFIIQDLKESYQIGEELFVTVHAKDFDNKSKHYGGDFFQAKLFWAKTKASVFGEVVDLLNGSYSVRFLLPWVGEAQVAVRLIHSSEAVQVLKHHRASDYDRVFFKGYYEGPGPNKTRLMETVKCNVKWSTNGIENMGTGDCCCDYNDPRTGETWRCQRPKLLPCSALVYHSLGGYRNRLIAEEKMLMIQTNKGINGDKRIIKICNSGGNETIDVTEKCRPGLHTPVPAGFYLKDVWTSFVCNTRHFTTQTTTECLKDKHIYMMGDSTMRQWFEFFVKAVPTLKQMNLHGQYQSGPLIAVDVANNIDLHWRAHGVPVRTRKTAVASLHYMSNEMDDLAGGLHTVIVFNMGPHFTTYPLDFFTHRVLRIRKAVLALLQRAPDTTVIIKTVNTGYKVVWSYAANERKNHPPPNFLSLHIAALHRNSTSPSVLSSEESISFYSDFGINSDDYSRLQQAVYWASPDRAITNVSMSTSPGHTTFIIQDLKESYQIGEELFVTVHAKDFDNKSKHYGGDFFQAKLFWAKTKASVFGEVVDLLNGK